jgi:hypothetical protein
VWRIVYQVTDRRDKLARIAQGSVGFSTLEQALRQMAKRIREGIGSGIDLAEPDKEEYQLEASIVWSVPLPSSCSKEG